MRFHPGDRLGSFEILSSLGAGGMGEVYRARDGRLGREVAIKVLREGAAGDPDRLARLQREARSVAALNHPNIVTLYSVERSGGVDFLAMELVRGQILSQLVRPGGLQLGQALELGTALARALAAAHEKGIVHRDLKPANLILGQDGRLRVLDFGLAKVTPPSGEAPSLASTADAPLTATGAALGTAPYMAPEQIRGLAVDARTDLFAFGVILYELLCGQRPFSGVTQSDEISSILRDSPKPIRSLRSEIPERLADLVDRCLEKEPWNRVQSASELVAVLRLVRSDLLVSSPGDHLGSRPPSGIPSRLILPGTVGLLLILTSGALLLPRLLSVRGVPRVDPDLLAVFPFNVSGPTSEEYLGRSAQIVMTGLFDGLGSLRCAQQEQVNAALGAKSEPPTASQASAIATALGAGSFMIGHVLVTGHQLRVDCSVHYRADDRDTVIFASAEGLEDSLSIVVTRVARALASTMFNEEAGSAPQFSGGPPPSLEALKLYGSAMAATNDAETIELLDHASHADTSFALAWYQLAWLESNTGEYDAALTSSEHALHFADRLPLRSRLHLQASCAALRMQLGTAEELYVKFLDAYPDDGHGWLDYGQLLFGMNTLRGRRISEARLPLLVALRLEGPSHRTALEMLERIGMRTWDRALVDSIVHLRRRQHLPTTPDDVPAETWLVLTQDASSPEGDHAPANLNRWGPSVAAFAGDLDAAVDYEKRLVAQERTARWQVLDQCQGASIAQGGGRIETAREFLRSAATLDTVASLFDGALLACAVGAPYRTSELDSLRRSIKGVSAYGLVRTPLDGAGVLTIDGPPIAVRLYLLGLLSAQLGRRYEARGYADSLAALRGDRETRLWADNYARGIRARLAMVDGRPQDALRELSGVNLGTKMANRTFFQIMLHERFTKAMAYLATGDYQSALNWFTCIGDVFINDLAYSGQCETGAARACEGLGRPAEAIVHYERACQIWKGCDEACSPMLDDARSRLERLRPR